MLSLSFWREREGLKMRTPLFSASWYDWSGWGGGDEYYSGTGSYRVYGDGTCETGMIERPLPPEAFERLKALLYGDFLQAKTHQDAFDGEGWEMTLYDEDGNVVHETGTGYIYGVPVLEEIVRILNDPGPRVTWDPDDPLNPDNLLKSIIEHMRGEQIQQHIEDPGEREPLKKGNCSVLRQTETW